MPSKLKKSLQIILSFLLAGVFLYLAFRGVDFNDLWNSLQSVNYLWIALLIPIVLISHWLRAVRWAYLLSPMKSPISHRKLFSAVMIGFMVNNVLPRVGELVRAFAIGRSEGISKSSAFGTVVVERIIDMLTFLSILSGVLFFYPHSLDPFVDDVDAVRPFFLIGSLVFVAIFVVLFFKAESMFRWLGALKLVIPKRYTAAYQGLLDSFLSGFGVARKRDKFAAIIGLSFLMYFFYALSLYVPFFAFSALEGHGLDFGASVILLTISTVAFALPAPGALGTYHSFLRVALVRLYAVDSTTALSFTIVTHEVGYIITTAIGLFYFLKDHIKVSEVAREATEGKMVKP